MRSVSMLAGQHEHFKFSLSEAGVFVHLSVLSFYGDTPVHNFPRLNLVRVIRDSMFSIEALVGQKQGDLFYFK